MFNYARRIDVVRNQRASPRVVAAHARALEESLAKRMRRRGRQTILAIEHIAHADVWLGYGRRVFAKFHWDIQLNITNVSDRTDLVPQRALNTGQAINFGLDAPRSFILTNTLLF